MSLGYEGPQSASTVTLHEGASLFHVIVPPKESYEHPHVFSVEPFTLRFRFVASLVGRVMVRPGDPSGRGSRSSSDFFVPLHVCESVGVSSFNSNQPALVHSALGGVTLRNVDGSDELPEKAGEVKFHTIVGFALAQHAFCPAGQVVEQTNGFVALPPGVREQSVPPTASVPLFVHVHSLPPSQNASPGVQTCGDWLGSPLHA